MRPRQFSGPSFSVQLQLRSHCATLPKRTCIFLGPGLDGGLLPRNDVRGLVRGA
jgi:hypothetical protein